MHHKKLDINYFLFIIIGLLKAFPDENQETQSYRSKGLRFYDSGVVSDVG